MKQLKLVFVCEQIKAQQVIPDKVKRAFVESFCNHSPSLPLKIKQFSSESLWKPSYIHMKIFCQSINSGFAKPFTWWPPSAGEWGRWPEGWWPRGSRSTGSASRSWSGWGSPVEERRMTILSFFFYFSPLCGRRRETDSRLMASSTSLLEQKRNPSLFIKPCLLIKGYFDLALLVQPPKLRGEGQIMPNSAARGGRI